MAIARLSVIWYGINIISKHVDTLLEEVLAPYEVIPSPSPERMFACPCVDVWAGGTTRNRRAVLTPLIVVSVEENIIEGRAPRIVALHAQFPLKPSVILPANELLSLSFHPGLHHLLAHVPKVDTARDDETVAGVAIIFTRTSAFADFACSDETKVYSDMLRSGKSMRDLHAYVASKGNRWAIRHVVFQREDEIAPTPTHPLGCVDGSNDNVPDYIL